MLDAIGKVMGIVDKVLPDTAEGRRMRAELERGWMDALSASDANQTQLNAADASSGDKYRSRARPTALWICVAGLFYDLLMFPMLVWVSVNWGIVPPPKLSQESLYALTMGLLGLGTLRSHDIWRGKR